MRILSACVSVLVLQPNLLSASESSCSHDGVTADDCAHVGGAKMLQKERSKTARIQIEDVKIGDDEQLVKPSAMSFQDTEVYTAQFKYARRVGVGEACDGQLEVSGKYGAIETKEDCERAFKALPHHTKTMEVIKTVNVAFEPTGCYSKAFSNHAGYYLRRFNENNNTNGIEEGNSLLCTNVSAQHLAERFIRVSEVGATCRSKGYKNIADFQECAEAFLEHEFEKSSEQVYVVSTRWEPKGCFSDCFDEFAGFMCRKFNKHKDGNGEGGDGENRFLMCTAKERPRLLDKVDATTTTTTTAERARYVRQKVAGEKCDGQFRAIDTLEKCEEAFADLKFASKELERITAVEQSFAPKGCYSRCFSEFAGHHCRNFNSHPNAEPLPGSWKNMLCKDATGHFVRLDEAHASCGRNNYTDITNIEDCALAFESLRYVDKESEKVMEVSYRSQPKGCFSSCFDEFHGFGCRKFNRHRTGSGEGSDGNSRFVLCEA
eukprot:TRINITY_DN185_c0_g2_i2.p1 TRINITY_DN185_c0_g2~~TRINITY_DN185_c0_g2_i2.p1  ORF type:complete len:490 (-),score=74.65 TRINITY_DN185_c0_g2_i2:284-1753(-)